MIKYLFLGGGLAFYFFAINTLITIIRDQNFTQSFVRLIDDNSDGVVTAKEFKAFNPCPKYDGKKINKAFSQFAKRADVFSLAAELTPKIVLKSIENCVENVQEVSQDKKIKDLSKDITEKFLAAYDIDNDKEIRFSQYHIANQFLQKTPKNIRQIFKFFDKNHDWKITEKQLQKSKPKSLPTFLASGKRK